MQRPTRWREVDFLLSEWARKGGKRWRRRQVRRVRAFLAFCRAQGVRYPQEIGKRHAIAFYKRLRASRIAANTLRHWEGAVRVVFAVLGRSDAPEAWHRRQQGAGGRG